MSSAVRFGSVIFGIAVLIFVVIALSNDVEFWPLIGTVAIVVACGGLAFFIRSRFTEEGQAERLAAEGLRTGAQRRNITLKSRTLAYAAVAVGSFLTGLQAFFNSGSEGTQASSVASLLTAAIFGLLAVREHRNESANPDVGLDSNPLAVLNATPTNTAPKKPSPIGSPTTTLVIIAIFTILLTIADIRLIRMASKPNDVWIGVGQMALWLPVFGYLAYREFRRMKQKPPQPWE
jgi:hypothetical protein